MQCVFVKFRKSWVYLYPCAAIFVYFWVVIRVIIMSNYSFCSRIHLRVDNLLNLELICCNKSSTFCGDKYCSIISKIILLRLRMQLHKINRYRISVIYSIKTLKLNLYKMILHIMTKGVYHQWIWRASDRKKISQFNFFFMSILRCKSWWNILQFYQTGQSCHIENYNTSDYRVIILDITLL